MSPVGARAGWYPDPYGRRAMRWFDGVAWTDQVVVDETTIPAPAPTVTAAATPPSPRPVAPTEAARLRAVLAELDSLRHRGLLDIDNHTQATADVARRLRIADAPKFTAPKSTAPATPAPTRVPGATSTPPRVANVIPTPAPTPRPTPVVRAVQPARPAPAPVPTTPTWAADAHEWVRGALASIRSDLAVHGLAYLGVLLFFGGILGFVVFAFGDVSTGLRPVAEAVIPFALFGAAWFLQRRGSELVGTALEFLGGALLPIVLTASFVDGADVPPDARGTRLAWTLALAMAALAGAYALVARRRPDSPLRFLVAPVVWLGVTFAAATTNPDFTGGNSISRVGPWQLAIVAVAIALTALLVRTRRGHAIADATDLVVLPGFAVALVLGVLGAVRLGLTGGPLVLAGLAAWVIFAAQRERLGATATAVGQVLALAAALTGVGMLTTPAWAGVAATAVFLASAEWEGRRHASPRVVEIALAPVLAGLTLAVTGTPAPALVAWGGALLWAHARRVRTVGWLPTPITPDQLALAATVGTGAVAMGMLSPAVGLVVAAALLAAVAIFVRLTAGLAAETDERTWIVALPALTATMLLVIAAAVDTVSDSAIAVTALLLLAPALVGTRALVLRVWLTAAVAAVAVVAGSSALGIDARLVAVAGGILGLALVAVAALRTDVLWTHLGALGHVVGLGAVGAAIAVDGDHGVAVSSTATIVVLGLASLALTTTAFAQELRSSAVVALLVRRVGAGATALAPTLAMLGWGATVVLTSQHVAGTTRSTVGEAWALLALAAIAAVLTRVASRDYAPANPHRAAAKSLVVTGSMLAVAALLGTAEFDAPWTTMLLTAGATSLVLVVPAVRRTRLMRLVGWCGTLATLLLGAVALDASTGALRIVVFAWGAAALLGALAVDERLHGRRAPAQWPKTFDWSSLAVLGVLAGAFAVWASAVAAPSTLGWWALAAAGVTLVAALQLRAPWVSLASCAGLVAAVALLPAAQPPANLWWVAGAMTGFLFVAVLVERMVPRVLTADDESDPLAQWQWRWDLPAFLTANALAVWIVAGAEQTRTPVALYLTAGMWALAAGGAVLVARRRSVAGVTWLVAGVVLLEVGAGRAGPGWLALGLALAALLSTVLAGRAHTAARAALQVTGAAAAWGAAAAFVWWTEPAVVTVTVVAAGVTGVLTLALAAARRFDRLGDDWVLVWGVPSVATVAGAAIAAMQLGSLAAGLTAAGALVLVAASATLLAAPLALPLLRDASVALVASAVGVVLSTAVASVEAIALVAGGIGFAATVTVAALAWRRPASVWMRPALDAAAIAAVASLGAGIAAWPARDLLVAALTLLGAEAAVVGLALQRLDLLGVAPVLLCSAWLVFAGDALQGNPQWFTVPIGVTILVVEGLVRATRRARGLDPHVPAIVAIDYAGMAFLVGASLVQIVTTSAWYVVLAIALGALLMEWSIATKVLHRAWFAMGTIVAALLIAVLLPIVEYVPHLEGAGLWITIAGLGLAALVAAAFLEAGKRRAETELEHLRSLTRAWER